MIANKGWHISRWWTLGCVVRLGVHTGLRLAFVATSLETVALQSADVFFFLTSDWLQCAYQRRGCEDPGQITRPNAAQAVLESLIQCLEALLA